MTDPDDNDVPTIMIVEDVFMVRKTIELMLKSVGYNVVEASETSTAMTMLKHGTKPDLILLDIMMPGIDGIGFLKVIKRFPPTKDIPVIMCTAQGQKETVATALKLGAADFMVKPPKREMLLEKVAKVLENRALGEKEEEEDDDSGEKDFVEEEATKIRNKKKKKKKKKKKE